MGMRLTHTTIWALDQDEALEFYTRKLGFEVTTDARIDGFRWLTVSPPDQPDHELILLEPTERPYGIEATLRDDSGNWFSMTERPRTRGRRVTGQSSEA